MATFLFFLIGACLGSFIPCFAERRQKALPQSGRSCCMHCGTPIAPLYLVPVLGYFFSAGRCRHCGAPIPKALPLIELFSGIVCALLSLRAAPLLHLLLLCVVFALLLLLSLDDWQLHHIRDIDLLLLAALLFADSLLFGAHFWLDQLIGAGLIALPLLLIQRIYPQGLGSGDVIFMAITGFYFGSLAVTTVFLIGIFCALIYVLWLLTRKKASRGTALPLIPFLSTGFLFTLLEPSFFI